MAQTYTKAEKFLEWEAEGEESVRTKYKLGNFAGDKKALVELWLEGKDQARREASQSESLDIARSAKDAAWVAAEAAREASRAASSANRLAKIALSVAIIIPALIAYFD